MFPKPENASEYKDLLRSAVDAPDVILEMPVRFEVKRDKFDPRLLILTQYRLYIVAASKVSGKVESSYNILDVSHIESASRTSLKLTFGNDSKPCSFLSPHPVSSPADQNQAANYDFDSFLSAFVYAFRLTFPESSRRPLPTIITVPASRIDVITATFGCVSSPNAAATFSAAYRCLCDRLNAEYKPFVAWDVDTIFWMHEDREMAFCEFEQGPVDTLSSKDYLPLFGALQYDTWFTSLNMNHIKLTAEIVSELCNILATNRTLTDLRLANVSGRSLQELLSKIQATLERSHSSSTISLLDLSGNSFDDKAISSLCSITGCLASRLSYLSLGRCQLAKNQICQLADAPGLRGAAMSGNLTHLDLSSSACKSDDTSAALCNLISSATSLRHLNLSATDINLQHLGNALSVGAAVTLVYLDLSQNISAFRQHASSTNNSSSQLVKFFQVVSGLKRLSLAENKLSTEFVRQLMAAFVSNNVLSELDIDLASNELQKTSGAAAALVEALPRCNCFNSLNVSDNGLDSDFGRFIEASSRCNSLVKLNCAKNMPSNKFRLHVAEHFASILQSPDTRLRLLDVSDCRLRQATSTLCAALTDARLTELDISGNLMSDSGVVYLAKALQGNTRLRRLNIDRNQMTLSGLQVLVSALAKNYTLTSVPTPLADVAQLITAKASIADKCSHILAKMEILLTRNRESSAFGVGHTVAKQVFRFQTGCGISENLEALWQMYAEAEHIFLSIQPPGIGVTPSPSEEPVLHEASESLAQVRDVLRKLSSMKYPPPNLSERGLGDNLEQVAKQSFHPVTDNLVQIVEMLSDPRNQLPLSISNVRQVIDQTAQSCLTDCQRETSRALTQACQMCHYAALFRVLEAITITVRNRLRDCKAALLERVTKGRTCRAPLAGSNSLPGTNGPYYPVSKYGTLNRRQRPVSAMTPEMTPSYNDDAVDEVNGLYAVVAPSIHSTQKSTSSRKPLTADTFALPESENTPTPTPLLSNPCKGRPRKPKNQKPTKPVVATENMVVDTGPLLFGEEANIEPSAASNGNHNNNFGRETHPAHPGHVVHHSRGRRINKSPSPDRNHHHSNGNSIFHTTPLVAANAIPVSARNRHSQSRERSLSNSGDELLKDSKPEASLLGKTSLTKAVVGGVKVGPTVNLGEFKLKKTGLTPTGEASHSEPSLLQNQQQHNIASDKAEEHNVQPSALLKRLSSNDDHVPESGSGNISVLRPKPPAKPIKPPKPTVGIPIQSTFGSLKETSTPSGNRVTASTESSSSNDRSGSRSPPPFSDSSAQAFADRMSRFGGSVASAKTRRDQVARSMIDVAPSSHKTPRPSDPGSESTM